MGPEEEEAGGEDVHWDQASELNKQRNKIIHGDRAWVRSIPQGGGRIYLSGRGRIGRGITFYKKAQKVRCKVKKTKLFIIIVHPFRDKLPFHLTAPPKKRSTVCWGSKNTFVGALQ